MMNADEAKSIAKESNKESIQDTLEIIYKYISQAAGEGCYTVRIGFAQLKWDQLTPFDKQEICKVLVAKGYKGQVVQYPLLSGEGHLTLSWNN